MRKGTQYKLPLASLPLGVSEYSLVLDSGFFRDMDNPDVIAADVHASVGVEHKNNAFYLHIQLKGMMQIPCDRCLEAMGHEVDATYDLTVRYGLEYDDSTDGLLILPENENHLDLAPLLYDTAVLSIPMRHVHEEGGCNPEMDRIMHQHENSGNDSPEIG